MLRPLLRHLRPWYGLLAGLLAIDTLAAPPPANPDTAYLLTSFHRTGDGLHYAYSSDALTWTGIDGVFLKSRIGGKLFRDPFILHCPDGVYRLLWTTGWHDRVIGFSQSTDLVHWTEPRALPVMAAFPAKNCWAPKMLHDPATGLYHIYWTSEVDGWFTEEVSRTGFNNRTFQVTTRDFTTFSEPGLLIEPGFDHVDPNIVAWRGGYLATFKHGEVVKDKVWGSHHAATAKTPGGPYTLIIPPIISGLRTDAVALLPAGDQVLYFVNRYAPRQLCAYATTDGLSWTDVSHTINRSPAVSQGNILTLPLSLLNHVKASAAAPSR